MTAAKGGGVHVIDIPRTESIIKLKERLLNLFFESKVNMAAHLSLSEIKESFVGNFCQSSIPLIHDGEENAIDKYAAKMATTPIRIYLHTVSTLN